MLHITANQLFCHAIGDYLLQSSWMATGKRRKWLPAIAHVCTYSLPFAMPFLIGDMSWAGLAFIAGSHLVIDHFGLARYLVFLKNFLSPPGEWKTWNDCVATGYSPEVPDFLAVWLMIIADNVLHVACNAIAQQWF